MDYIYIGKIVNTHGIKGEIKIISNFKYKESIFKKNIKIYIGDKKLEKTVNTYRHHKNFDMITLIGINDINDCLVYKGEDVYVLRCDFTFPGVLDQDIIGLEVYTDSFKGIVTDIITSKAHDILIIVNNEIKYYVPYIDEFIDKIDLENKKIIIKDMKGLFDEN